MILEKEREEVSIPAQQPAEAIPYEPAPSGAAPRKMIKCPSKTGIKMNTREKRTGEMLTLVIGLAVILLMAGLAFGGGLASVISPAKLQNAAASIDKLGAENQVIRVAFVFSLTLTAITSLFVMFFLS